MPGFGTGGQTSLQGEVNKIVESMSPSQLYEIMTQMKVRCYFLIRQVYVKVTNTRDMFFRVSLHNHRIKPNNYCSITLN